MDKKSPGILVAIDDKDSLIYFGHLAAQAEIALPKAPREAQIALTWLCAHVAFQQVRLWSATFEDITVNDVSIGNWRLQARTSRYQADRITMERYATLQEDGRQIGALAHTFFEDLDQPSSKTKGINSVLEFSVMTLASQAGPAGISATVKDMYGTKITVRASMKKKSNFASNFFSFKNKVLKVFF